MYGSEAMLWKEERSRIRAVQMDNLRGLLGIRRMIRVLMIRLMRMLQWFGYVERMKNDRIAKRWIYTIKECLRKRGLDVREAMRMVQDRSE